MRTYIPSLLIVFALFCWASNNDYLDAVKQEQHEKVEHKKVARLDAARKAMARAEFNRLAAEAEYFTGMKAGMK